MKFCDGPLDLAINLRLAGCGCIINNNETEQGNNGRLGNTMKFNNCFFLIGCNFLTIDIVSDILQINMEFKTLFLIDYLNRKIHNEYIYLMYK